MDGRNLQRPSEHFAANRKILNDVVDQVIATCADEESVTYKKYLELAKQSTKDKPDTMGVILIAINQNLLTRGINIESMEYEELYYFTYTAYVLLEELQNELSEIDQDQNETDQPSQEDIAKKSVIKEKVTVFNTFLNLLKENLFCKKAKITSQQLSDTIKAQNEKWLNAEQNDQALLRNKMQTYLDTLDHDFVEIRLLELQKKTNALQEKFDLQQCEYILRALIQISSEDKADENALKKIVADLSAQIKKAYPTLLSNNTQDVELATQLNFLLLIVNPEYQKARTALAEAVKVNPGETDTPLKKAGRDVLYHADQVMRTQVQDMTIGEVKKLTRCISGTAKVIKEPTYDNIIAHANNTNEILNVAKDRSGLKLFAGAMIAVVGVLLIAASITVAITSFGFATPLSALGIALGGNIITAGVAIGTAAAGIAMATKGSMFADQGRKGNLAVAGEDVLAEARKEDDKRLAPKGKM